LRRLYLDMDASGEAGVGVEAHVSNQRLTFYPTWEDCPTFE